MEIFCLYSITKGNYWIITEYDVIRRPAGNEERYENVF